MNGDDLLWAMQSLGFDDAVVVLTTYLQKIREVWHNDFTQQSRSTSAVLMTHPPLCVWLCSEVVHRVVCACACAITLLHNCRALVLSSANAHLLSPCWHGLALYIMHQPCS